MDGFGNDFSLAFASLVAIINPLGVAFVFRRLTIWAMPSERAQLSTRIALYAMAVILGSYFFGRFVLGFFGITLPALRIAGGIIVALCGWQLLNRSEQSASPEVTKHASPVSMAFFPLTMPLTAGPGTITVAIALGAARAERSGIGVLIARAAFFLATLAVVAIVLLCYRNADRLVQLVGQEGARVVTSLSAFLLLCVGVQIITAGAIDLARLAIAQG
jgi:multiple antibiotic resistance protein